MNNEQISAAIKSYLAVDLVVQEKKKFWRNNVIPVIIQKLQGLEQETSINVLSPIIERISFNGLAYSLIRPNDKFEPKLSGISIKNTITFSETHDGSVSVVFHIISPTDERTYRHSIFEPKTPDKLDYDELISNILIEFIEAMHPVWEEPFSYEKPRLS